jgi:DNA-binding transcriptional LysR family regulator
MAWLSPRVACSIIPAKLIKRAEKPFSINGKQMTAEFNWDDARIFLAIARAGTLSGAADKMNMGIATVSRRLDRLEQALNVPLFSRHQSGYRLTDDGEALLARAEALEYAGLAFGEAAQLQACRRGCPPGHLG